MGQENTSMQTVWVPGHAGWQGQQRSTTGLVVLGVLLAAAITFYGATLVSDPAPAMKVLGLGVVVAVGIAIWLLVVHLQTTRVRIVRLVVDGSSVVFRGAAGTVWPLRALVLAGVLLLAGWAWSVSTVPADRMTTLTLLGVPVVALSMAIAGARSWFRPLDSHRLTLRPEGVELRIPRNGVDATWDEVSGAVLEGDRVVVRTTTARPSSWATRDLASDPVVLAEIVTFYGKNPEARAEIGAATLARLRSGNF